MLDRKQCYRCGLYEPVDAFDGNICKYCLDEKSLNPSNIIRDGEPKGSSNPYFELGFFEFAIVSTLMIVFFPWSLLFCVVFLGMEDTKNLIALLLHDLIKTIFVVALIAIPLVIILIIILITYLNNH